jgi:hypothetical protein
MLPDTVRTVLIGLALVMLTAWFGAHPMEPGAAMAYLLPSMPNVVLFSLISAAVRGLMFLASFLAPKRTQPTSFEL